MVYRFETKKIGFFDRTEVEKPRKPKNGDTGKVWKDKAL
jgi:hypothetical protein